MITITWHLVLLIIAIIAAFIWAITRDNKSGWGALTERFFAVWFWVLISATAILIYGGIFWW